MLYEELVHGHLGRCVPVPGALINFVVAILVSKVTAEPPEHIQHLVEDIRVPKGAALPPTLVITCRERPVSERRVF